MVSRACPLSARERKKNAKKLRQLVALTSQVLPHKSYQTNTFSLGQNGMERWLTFTAENSGRISSDAVYQCHSCVKKCLSG